MRKDLYEISLWQDKLDKDGAYYDEEKVVVIGSDTMTSPCRAVEPKLIENINGTNTLTFKLYYTYIDTETGKREDNPYIKLLTNERRVKCKWKNKWYEFVIKGIQEDSNGKTITYTCKDLFINELSKTGFNLEFDNKLENNQGTVKELGEKILEGTDWKIGDSDTIEQTLEESLYGVKVPERFNIPWTDGTGTEFHTFLKNTYILIPYSTVEDRLKNNSFVQFFYSGDEDDPFTSTEKYSKYSYNGSNLLIGLTCYYIEGSNSVSEFWRKLNFDNEVTEPEITLTNWRADRLVREPLQEYSALVNRYCDVYKNSENKKLYKYITTEYNDPTTVQNLLVNSKDFKDTNGWVGDGLGWILYPPFDDKTQIDKYNATTYLKIEDSKSICNTGIKKSSMYIENGFQSGEKYIFRVKGYEDKAGSPNINSPLTLPENAKDIFSPKILPYEKFKNPTEDSNTPYYFHYDSNKDITAQKNSGWIEYVLVCNKSITKKDIDIENLCLALTPKQTCWIEEIQFFKEERDAEGNRINPGEMDKQSAAKLVYRYFDPETQIDPDNIEFIYSGETDITPGGYFLIYPKDKNGNYTYEKIRSITGKQSNRFNLLQSLAETFECWVRFEILHDEITGKILREKGSPKKYVHFKKEVGHEVGYGFVYGIDLKTISRSIDSNQLATKVIVVPNVNEYAKNGVCEIAQSVHNPAKENFIINFDYFINQGLLDGGAFNRDLLLPSTSGGIGYYPELKKLNTEYYDSIELVSAKKIELDKQKSMLSLYKQYVISDDEQITALQLEIAQLAGFSTFNDSILDLISNYIRNNNGTEKISSMLVTLTTLKKVRNSHQEIVDKLTTSISALGAKIKDKENRQEEIIKELENLHRDFNTKYSRFIQEGSWTSQDYLDENLYYLDARSVAYTSSRPKISYNISVIRLSALKEFEGKVFNVGDISYIQDKEFFGTDIYGTPYKEKVLISEIISNFDSPKNDTFKIQNYKTQFEDLFQRITATTQSLQYTTGEYQRAASIVEDSGAIKPETLQLSLAQSANLLYSSQNNTIIQDSTGILLINESNAAHQTKITSNGVFITVDGGVTWKNAIRGEGVATQYLTSGSINTRDITIVDGVSPAFRWDSSGINAYKANANGGYSSREFVRFDKYGLYGVKNFREVDKDKEFRPTSENDIWNEAQFGLTWKGFFLKNKNSYNKTEYKKTADESQVENKIYYIFNQETNAYEEWGGANFNENKNNLYEKIEIVEGGIEISSENDITVFEAQRINGEEKRIKYIQIGKIGGEGDNTEPPIYGIRIKNIKDETVMETNSTGDLWLKNRLNIGTIASNVSVGIGKLEGGQVINANNKFIVTEDGTITATEGVFSGTINAAEGYLGNGNVKISKDGITFYNGGLIGYTAYFRKTEDSSQIKDKIYYVFNQEIGSYEKWEGTDFNTDKDSLYEYVQKETLLFENGDLVFSGKLSGATGSFSGDISGASGTFTGGVRASFGSIGGFKIEENLLSTPGIKLHSGIINYKKTEDNSQVEGKTYYSFNQQNGVYEKWEGTDFNTDKNNLYEISEENGKIIVDKIELGSGAVVTGQIALGNKVVLKNPDLDNNNARNFLEVKDNEGVKISINDNCEMTLGELKFDGKTSKISGTNWNITPNTATFGKIIAESGTIENVVFKNSTVQAAGGQMIFKPSFQGQVAPVTVESSGENSNLINFIPANDHSGLNKNDYVLLNRKGKESIICQVEEIAANSDSVSIILNSFNKQISLGDESNKEATITKLCSELNNELSDSLLIGVNPDSSSMGGKDPHTNLFRQGITFINAVKNTGAQEGECPLSYEETPVLFLGNLNNLMKEGISGYGLYGNNVFLHGALTTEIGTGNESTYAGVNTNSRITSTLNEFGGSSGNIVFFAGAKDLNTINKSSFFVTDKGYIYSKKAFFEESVFVGSRIESSKIYAADIYGGASEALAPLTIHSTSNGINFNDDDFFEGDKKISKTILQINSDSFKYLNTDFINFNIPNSVLFTGSYNTSVNEQSKFLKIAEQKITNFIKGDSDEEESSIDFSNKSVTIKRGVFSTLALEENKVTCSSPSFGATGDVIFGTESSKYLKYRKTNNGYNLYVE